MKLCPEDAEEFIDYLIKSDRLDEAAIKLGDIVNDEKFTSKEGKSKHQLWHELCDLMTKNPDKVRRMKLLPDGSGANFTHADRPDQPNLKFWVKI